MATGTWNVRSQSTSATATGSVSSTNHDAAVAAALAAVGATGAGAATGAQISIPQCGSTGAAGPTGTYIYSYNITSAVTGATFSADGHEDAVNKAVAVGPTGPGSGIQVLSAVA